MKYTPRPHDLQGIQHLTTHERALLFSEMGLGKTGQALSAITQLLCDGAISGALVVAPMRVANISWWEEVEKWDQFRWLKLANLRHDEGWDLLERGAAHVYTVNYEQLPSREVKRKVKRPPTEDELAKWARGELPFACVLPPGMFADEALLTDRPPPGVWFYDTVTTTYPGVIERYFFGRRKAPAFDLVVFDESTKVKNPMGLVGRSFKPYWPKIKRRWALTGTPRPEHLKDLFGQVKIIDDGLRLGQYVSNFEAKYFYIPEGSWKLLPKKGAEAEIMEKISDITLALRAEDHVNIVRPEFKDVEIDLPKPARKAYDELETQLLAMLENEVEIVAVNAGALLTKLIQVAGGCVYDDNKVAHVVHDAKISALKKLVAEINEPVIIAFAFQHEKNRILEAIPGSVEWRDSIVPEWNRGEVPALVVHPNSVGHGLNLWQGGRTVIFYSRTYHREPYDQLCGRFVGARSALSGKVPQIFHLVARDTADEAADEALRLKAGGQAGLMAALSALKKLAACR
jgi:hypothetical protein